MNRASSCSTRRPRSRSAEGGVDPATSGLVAPQEAAGSRGSRRTSRCNGHISANSGLGGGSPSSRSSSCPRTRPPASRTHLVKVTLAGRFSMGPLCRSSLSMSSPMTSMTSALNAFMAPPRTELSSSSLPSLASLASLAALLAFPPSPAASSRMMCKTLLHMLPTTSSVGRDGMGKIGLRVHVF